jgi:HNH endonuclease
MSQKLSKSPQKASKATEKQTEPRAKRAPKPEGMTESAAPRERKNLPIKTRTALLTEAGYRCAVPRCRQILAMDMHHIYEVHEGGSDDLSNLIALCSYCHDLYHRGTISRDSIFAYKAMLVAISRAFDIDAVDRLLFLAPLPKDYLIVSGDGVLHFARLIAANLATVELKTNNNDQIVTYAINISENGRQIIEAWRQGDRTRLKQILGGPVPGMDSSG